MESAAKEGWYPGTAAGISWMPAAGNALMKICLDIIHIYDAILVALDRGMLYNLP